MTEYVTIENGCWLWKGDHDGEGYAVGPDGTLAWHIVWEKEREGAPPVGARPACNNRGCVNPDHWVAVSDSDEMRFWKYVKHYGDHWIWKGALVRKKYPYFWDGDKSVPAYRFAWQITKKEKPGRLRRKADICNEPLCVNPDHFYEMVSVRSDEEKLSRQELADKLRADDINAGNTKWWYLPDEAMKRMMPFFNDEIKDEVEKHLDKQALDTTN